MDPDQTFDPADPTGTTAHEIPVTNAAFLKIALNTADLTPANPAIDIDLYLYNSAGEEVAASTAGGTVEEIVLEAPADDTYTLYVHGWQTAGSTVTYNLHTWQVRLTRRRRIACDQLRANVGHSGSCCNRRGRAGPAWRWVTTSALSPIPATPSSATPWWRLTTRLDAYLRCAGHWLLRVQRREPRRAPFFTCVRPAPGNPRVLWGCSKRLGLGLEGAQTQPLHLVSRSRSLQFGVTELG